MNGVDAVHWVLVDQDQPHDDVMLLFDMGDEEFPQMMLPESLVEEWLWNMSVAVSGEFLFRVSVR